MADHREVDPHRFDRFGGILQTLPFVQAGGSGREIEDFGPQLACRDPEGDFCPGAVFDEEIEDPPALEGGRFAKFVGRNSFQIERQLQDLLNLGLRKVFDPQKVS